jgi:hypothetical protein
VIRMITWHWHLGRGPWCTVIGDTLVSKVIFVAFKFVPTLHSILLRESLVRAILKETKRVILNSDKNMN